MREAEKRIDSLILALKQKIKGAESESLFYFIFFLPNFASSGAQRSQQGPTTLDPEWLRTMNGLTLALNKILPSLLPLKPVQMFDLQKYKESTKRELIPLVLIITQIGRWMYFIQNEYVNCIECEGDEVMAVTPSVLLTTPSYQEFVNKAALDYSALEWGEWIQKEWGKDRKIREAIDAELNRSYGFGLEEIRQESLFFEQFCKEPNGFISRSRFHQLLTKNIRSAKAEKLLSHLVFSKDNPSLYRSPFIPLKNSSFMIAQWVFLLSLHFESWIRPILELPDIYGRYASFIGTEFEDYLEDKIAPIADQVTRNQFFYDRRNPEISPWLEKLKQCGMKKRNADNFEIDMLVKKKNAVYVISCKGAKKELPKLSLLKLWAEFPPQEIAGRINENKAECEEISIEADCIKSSTRIVSELGFEGKSIIPVAVYSAIQPLAIPSIKQSFAPSLDTIIVTPEELINLLEVAPNTGTRTRSQRYTPEASENP